MRIEVENMAGNLLPNGVMNRLRPGFQMVDSILSGDDDNSSAQRMALLVFIVRVASAAIAFLSQVLLARWLGTFEYGVFVAVWVALIVAGVVASAGFPPAVTRLIAEYRQKKLPSFVSGSIRTAILVSFAFSTMLATAGACLLYFYPELVDSYYITPVYLAIICLPMLSVESVMEGTSRAFNWTFLATLPVFIVRPIGILLIIGIAILLGHEANAVTAMWAGVISCYVTTIVQFFFIQRKFPAEIKLAKPQYRVGSWVIIAIPLFLVEGFYMMQTSVDIMLVSAYLTPEDTAVYFAATKILALVHFVYFAVRAACAHRYTALHQSGDFNGFQQFVNKTVTWTFWPSALMAIVMMILGKYFLMLFGEEFVSAQSLIWILAVGIVIRSSVGPAEALLAMAGRQIECAAIYAVSLLSNIVLNISLIPVFGLQGAAVATTLALAIESAALHSVAKRKLGIHAFIIPARPIAKEGVA